MVAAQAELNRRSFLKLACSASVISGAGLILAACGGASSGVTQPPATSAGASAAPPASVAATPSAGASAASSSGAISASSGFKLPTYVPSQAVKPDLPGTPAGLDAAYFTYPKNPAKSVANPPGKGGDVNIMTWNTGSPMTPVDQNPAWQAINKDVGATLKINAVPFADYNTRIAAVVAGNDLPDIFYIPPNPQIQQLPQFLKARCADLTPYLSGDAVKDYPNLAAFPTQSWKGVVFNQGIYGVPLSSALWLWVLWVHKELLDQVGASYPKTADDYKRSLQEIMKANPNIQGLIADGAGLGVTNGLQPSIFKAPNNWRLESSGKLTASIETGEYKAAVGYARDMYSAGLYSPNSLSANNVQAKADFATRKSATRWDGFGGAGQQLYWSTAPTLHPPSQVRQIPPFSNDGSKPTYFFGSGTFGFAAIKQATPERVKEMLGILNWIGAPFGTVEHLLTNYGVSGADYQLDSNGNPIATSKAAGDVGFVWPYVMHPAPVLYLPKFGKAFAQPEYDEEKLFLAAGVHDPTVGYYSPTDGSKGNTLRTTFADGISDIVAGRRPLSDYDQLVKGWQTGGGETIRTEYLDAMKNPLPS